MGCSSSSGTVIGCCEVVPETRLIWNIGIFRNEAWKRGFGHIAAHPSHVVIFVHGKKLYFGMAVFLSTIQSLINNDI